MNQLKNISSFYDIPQLFYQQFSIADYRPGASISFALEKIITGNINPHISHFINFILYIICVYIFYKILQLLTNNQYIIQISTILFAILPLHTSMIANIKNRDGLLSFILGGIALYLLLKIKNQTKIHFQFIYLALAVLAMFAGIFCKLDAMIFLLIIPLIFIVRKNAIDLKFFLRIFIISIISFKLINFFFQFWMSSKNKFLSENTNIEELTDELLFTENPLVFHNHILEKLSLTIQTVFEYVIMIFKPTHHYFYYGYDVIPLLPITHPTIIIKLVLLAILFLSAIYFVRSKPLYSFGVLSTFIALAYCSNLQQPIAGIVADRYAFIASMGASIAMGCIIYEGLLYLKRKFSWTVHHQQLVWFISGILVLFYTPFNIVRSSEWKDLISIIEADMPQLEERSYEANRIAMSTYIDAGFDAGDASLRNEYLNKALNYGQNALRIYDKYYLPHEGVALAYFGLGRFPDAKQKALQNIAAFDTTLETTYRILADIYTKENKQDSLAWTYRKLQKTFPEDNYILLKTVESLFKSRQKDEAIYFCDSIIKINPNNGGAYQAKGYIYFESRDSLNGAVHAEKAFELGIRDNTLLDMTGYYWWPRDKNRFETLKKYAQ